MVWRRGIVSNAKLIWSINSVFLPTNGENIYFHRELLVQLVTHHLCALENQEDHLR